MLDNVTMTQGDELEYIKAQEQLRAAIRCEALRGIVLRSVKADCIRTIKTIEARYA